MTADPRTSNANAYLRTQVMTASPEQLRLMLLDGAIKFARQGREGLAKKDYEASYNGITQCRNIVVELMTTMKAEHAPELCDKMRALYTYLFNQLVEASLTKSTPPLDEVIKLLEYERQTWAMLMEKVAAERAGLTPAAAAPAAAGLLARPATPAGEPKPTPLSIQA